MSTFRQDQYDTLNELIAAEHYRIYQDLLCYGRAEYNVGELIDEVVKDHVGPGLWPTRDQTKDEEC